MLTFALCFHGIRFKVNKVGCRDDNHFFFYPYRKLQITSLIPHDIDITSAYAYINEKRLRSKSLNSFVAFNATFINPITINIPKIDPRASRPLL